MSDLNSTSLQRTATYESCTPSLDSLETVLPQALKDLTISELVLDLNARGLDRHADVLYTLAQDRDELLRVARKLAPVADAAQGFKVAVDREEAEYGFPFSFDLRDAHRAFVRALKTLDAEVY